MDLRIEFGDPLPIIKFDKDAITEVLMNFVGNALKFTTEGSVGINAQLENNEIHVKVQDSGPGIKSEDIARLFQPFEQLVPKRDGSKGGAGSKS